MPEETRRPVILFGGDPITHLIAGEIHWKYEHSVSRSLVLSTLHKTYAIIGIHRLVKRLSTGCIECQKVARAKPAEQLMGNLHNRLGVPQRAFAETGLDFAGPFETIQGRGKNRKQSFVLVLTCLQTRGVHFEPTTDQTTDSVVKALIRFSAVRGRPRILVSDNQTSFKAASREIKNYHQQVYTNKIHIEEAFNRNEEPVDWLFIPPRSPHCGGAWEIMVKAMKRALNAISQGQSMTEESFKTFLCQAMNIINNRPLLKNITQDTPHFITPNDFLVSGADTSLIPASANPQENETRLGIRWRQLETLTNTLWHRFIQEILPELAPRQKWKTQFNDLAVGTVVLVVEPGLPRGVWKTGLVTKVELGRDGFTREAMVKMGKQVYKRHITRLIPLLNE